MATVSDAMNAAVLVPAPASRGRAGTVPTRLAFPGTSGTPDAVVVLRSTWSRAVLGKTYALDADGGPDRPASYRAGMFFAAETIPVRDIRALHAVCERTAREGAALLVRGDLTGARVTHGPCPGLVTRRTAAASGDGHPPGLRDAARHWILLDLDDVPNLPGLDPRTHPGSAMDFLFALLPPAISRATVSWHWSSSTCVGTPPGKAPAALSAHLRVWLDTPLAHLECRSLLERLNGYGMDRLRAQGVEPADKAKLVDWKVAEPQQPHYVAAPRFQGMKDPLPGARGGLREGPADTVKLAGLLAELDAAGATAAPPAAKKAQARTAKAAALPRTAPVPRREGGEIVPLTTARALANARTGSDASVRMNRAPTRNAGLTRMVYAARTPREIVRLVRGRVAAGAADPRWRAWHEAGGVPEGRRDTYMFLAACLIAEMLPAAGLTMAKAEAAILEVGQLIVAPEWLREGWVKDRYGAAVVARAAAAGRGETETWRGRIKDPRYRVGKARLLMEFAPCPEEILSYGLKSVATDRDRLAAERRERGATPLAQTQAANAAKAREAENLMAAGSSQRAAAEAVGLHEKQLRRILRAGTRPPCAASVPPDRCGHSVVPVERKKSWEGEGRRKTFTARVRLRPGRIPVRRRDGLCCPRRGGEAKGRRRLRQRSGASSGRSVCCGDGIPGGTGSRSRRQAQGRSPP